MEYNILYTMLLWKIWENRKYARISKYFGIILENVLYIIKVFLTYFSVGKNVRFSPFPWTNLRTEKWIFINKNPQKEEVILYSFPVLNL